MFGNSHQWGKKSYHLCYMDPCVTWKKIGEGQLLLLLKTVKVLKYRLTLDIPSLSQKAQLTSVSVHLATACNCASLLHEALGCKESFFSQL